MTIQEKINRKGYNPVASYNNRERVGYFASHRIYALITRTYKTQGEVLKSLSRN
jgi:hypothetical protein